jgi:hypothetical protein
MFGLLSTLISEVQRETHRGVIGQQAYDQRTYEVLHGSGPARPPLRRYVLATTLLVSALAAVGMVLNRLVFP